MRDPAAVYTPPINPADIRGPSQEIYACMGRDNIYRMLEDFYRELGASPIRGMFPDDLTRAAHKSAAFFVQLLGGPPEYSEHFGPPRLRARHMPFQITNEARRQWLACFERVLEHAITGYGFPAQHLTDFRRFLQDFSLWMVNTADGDPSPDPT